MGSDGIGVEGQISAEYGRRRERVQATAAAFAAGADGVDIEHVLSETDSLLAYRGQIPEIRRSHRRGRDQAVFGVLAAVAGLDLIALIVCGFVGVIGWGWLVLLFPALIGLGVLLLAVDFDGGGDADGALAPVWGGSGLLLAAAGLSLLVLHGLGLLWCAGILVAGFIVLAAWSEHVGVRS